MTSHPSVVFIFYILFSTLARSETDSICPDECKFRFCDGTNVYSVPLIGNKPFSSAICAKSGISIGLIASTGEALLVEEEVVPISEWEPQGLRQHFAPSFFKTFSINSTSSGVGREEVQVNQLEFLDERCWILPISSYQVLGQKRNVIGTVETLKGPLLDCISFEMRL